MCKRHDSHFQVSLCNKQIGVTTLYALQETRMGFGGCSTGREALKWQTSFVSGNYHPDTESRLNALRDTETPKIIRSWIKRDNEEERQCG